MKILVSDFDKTLFDDNYDDNIEAVNDFVDRNNMFIIATGRHKPRLLKDLGDVKYNYLICNDGAVIYDKNLNAIFRITIDNDTAKEIIRFIEPEINSSISDWFIDTSEVYKKDLNDSINAILLKIKDGEEAKELMKKILDAFEVEAYISDFHINIRPKGTSKARAIDYIINEENIDKSNVYTIGDNVNDIEMIEEFNGYCMVNSIEEIKSKCINTVNSVEELIEKIK